MRGHNDSAVLASDGELGNPAFNFRQACDRYRNQLLAKGWGGGLGGLQKFSVSIYLPPIGASKFAKPVRFLPGLASVAA
jgi:hypothetical protein